MKLKKLNWFAPLPPAKTDIANYTFRILPELTKYVDIVLWTEETKWDKQLEQYAQVKCYQLNNIRWSDINDADLNVYHIGNNSLFHSSIWEISNKCPGIVVLHDFTLHEFFFGIYKEQKRNKYAYLQIMSRYYGQENKKIAQDFWDGKLNTEFMAKNYPLTDLAINNAVGVITHNKEAYQVLNQKNCSLIGYIPLPYANAPGLKAKKRLVKNRKPYKLIVFGHIGPNRRLESILEALATLPEKKNFHLDIYGELWNDSYIQGKINNLKLDKLVKIHGFVKEKVLHSALNNADLAINLRYPSMGEASGSQLRIWSHSLPTLVTKTNWYGMLPDNIVGFVRPEHEIEDIQKQLQSFLLEPEKFYEMGRRGKKLLEEQHSPKIYAKAMVDFMTEAINFRAYPLVNYLVKRVSEEMVYLGTNNLSKEQTENTAKAIDYLIS